MFRRPDAEPGSVPSPTEQVLNMSHDGPGFVPPVMMRPTSEGSKQAQTETGQAYAVRGLALGLITAGLLKARSLRRHGR
jgi:hypothetical protein